MTMTEEKATAQETERAMEALSKAGIQLAQPVQTPAAKPEGAAESAGDTKGGEYRSPFETGDPFEIQAPAPEPEAQTEEPSDVAPEPENYSRGIEDVADVLSGRAGAKQYTPDELRAGLVERGYDEAVADTLVKQHRKTDLVRIIEAPVPQSERTTDRPDTGSSVAPQDAGAKVDEVLAGIERRLIDDEGLEEGAAKALVEEFRKAGREPEPVAQRGDTEPSELAALKAQVAELQAASRAQSESRQADYRSDLQKAREGFGEQVPAILDDATFEARVVPQIEALYRARPDVYGSDIPALMRAAVVSTFGAEALTRTTQPTATPAARRAPSPAATPAPAPAPTNADDIGTFALQNLMAGKDPGDIVKEARRFRR